MKISVEKKCIFSSNFCSKHRLLQNIHLVCMYSLEPHLGSTINVLNTKRKYRVWVKSHVIVVSILGIPIPRIQNHPDMALNKCPFMLSLLDYKFYVTDYVRGPQEDWTCPTELPL